MKIINSKDLGINDLRKAVIEIVEAGLNAIDTEKAIKDKIKLNGNILVIDNHEIKIDSVHKIFAVAIGKCAFQSMKAFKEVIGERLTNGIVVDVKEGELDGVEIFRGDHPFPSENNVRATGRIIEFLKNTEENDLVLFFISGGGSVLLCQPSNFSYEKEISITRHLFKNGATIQEINTIRKHLSLARGGHLAQYAYPSRVISLIFSDVPGNDLQFIASGPTIKDETTREDAEGIINKYDIQDACNLSADNLIETPKDDKYFENVKNILFISNKTALYAMAEKAREFGYKAQICDFALSGEAKDVGEYITKEIKAADAQSVLLYGGETSVKISGDGIGGRNMELVLSALRNIGENELVLSIASDGRDNTDFAGALCDTMTKEKSAKLGINPDKFLGNNDSYSFFRQVGDYIQTGNTGSNVSDLLIAIKK